MYSFGLFSESQTTADNEKKDQVINVEDFIRQPGARKGSLDNLQSEGQPTKIHEAKGRNSRLQGLFNHDDNSPLPPQPAEKQMKRRIRAADKISDPRVQTYRTIIMEKVSQAKNKVEKNLLKCVTLAATVGQEEAGQNADEITSFLIAIVKKERMKIESAQSILVKYNPFKQPINHETPLYLLVKDIIDTASRTKTIASINFEESVRRAGELSSNSPAQGSQRRKAALR